MDRDHGFSLGRKGRTALKVERTEDFHRTGEKLMAGTRERQSYVLEKVSMATERSKRARGRRREDIRVWMAGGSRTLNFSLYLLRAIWQDEKHESRWTEE